MHFSSNYLVKMLCKKYLNNRVVRGDDTKDNKQISSGLMAVTGK